MIYLAIDLGDQRTGVAVADSETRIVSPLRVLEVPREKGLLEVLAQLVEQRDPDEVVLGLPLNMDGSEGPQAAIVRRFGHELQQRITRDVQFQDERLTTFGANQAMAGSGRTHRQKRQVRDALAAAEILRDFLDASPT